MPRTTKKTEPKIVAMPKARRAAQIAHQLELPESEIARRAYEIYCARGCQHGHDLDDWLQAKAELEAARMSAA
jgi:tRNA 2-selenouridine synthase SelU